jgi:hypothetical protein
MRSTFGAFALTAGLLASSTIGASCLTDSIGDNGPRAVERYLSCREFERRIEALEQAERGREIRSDPSVQSGDPNAWRRFYERRSAAYRARVEACVEQQTVFNQAVFEHRRPAKPAPTMAACATLTPEQKMDAALFNSAEVSRMIGQLNAGMPITHRRAN